MKRMFFLALLLAMISSVSFSRELVAKGKSNTSLGDYKIEKADNPVLLNGQQLKTYVISYQNSPMEVTVAIRQDKDCKSYIVLSDKLSVQYVCNGAYFGVQKMDKSLGKLGMATTDESLDRSEYFHQKLIIPGKQGELDATGLIAAYFPRLVKEDLTAAK